MELAQLKLSHGKPPGSDSVAEEATTRNDAAAALAAAGNEDAEVICIIRPHRAGNSKVVIINKASRKFMAYLTGEAKDQLQPTMGQAEAPPAAPAPATESSSAPSSISTASTQTTSAWKPTSAAARLQAR